MICFPNCKINIGLHVTGKRADGFHSVESVLYPVPFYDILEIVPHSGGEDEMSMTGISLDGETGHNTVFRAIQQFRAEVPIPRCRIHLHKRIPAGSGLGGGSSDAAHAILLLNRMFKPGFRTDRMKNMAARIGSDCAFFIDNQPAFASGRGELTKIIPLRLKGFHIILLFPGIHIGTKDAYRMVKPGKPGFDLRELPDIPVADWKSRVKNDFELPVFNAFPRLRLLKDKLYHSGALYASMSGSGSTLYGIFKELPDPGNQFRDTDTGIFTL